MEGEEEGHGKVVGEEEEEEEYGLYYKNILSFRTHNYWMFVVMITPYLSTTDLMTPYLSINALMTPYLSINVLMTYSLFPYIHMYRN